MALYQLESSPIRINGKQPDRERPECSPGVFQEGERQTGENAVLRVGAGHRFVFEYSLLPVRVPRPNIALVFQLGTFQFATIEMLPGFGHDPRRYHHCHLAHNNTIVDLPVRPLEFAYDLITRFVCRCFLVEGRFACDRVALRQRLPIRVDKERVETSRKAERMEDLVFECCQGAMHVTLLGRHGLGTDVDVAGDRSIVLGLELAVGGKCNRVADVAVFRADRRDVKDKVGVDARAFRIFVAQAARARIRTRLTGLQMPIGHNDEIAAFGRLLNAVAAAHVRRRVNLRACLTRPTEYDRPVAVHDLEAVLPEGDRVWNESVPVHVVRVVRQS